LKSIARAVIKNSPRRSYIYNNNIIRWCTLEFRIILYVTRYIYRYTCLRRYIGIGTGVRVLSVRDFFFRRSYPIDDFDTRTAPIILLYTISLYIIILFEIKKKIPFLFSPAAVVYIIVGNTLTIIFVRYCCHCCRVFVIVVGWFFSPHYYCYSAKYLPSKKQRFSSLWKS